MIAFGEKSKLRYFLCVYPDIQTTEEDQRAQWLKHDDNKNVEAISLDVNNDNSCLQKFKWHLT